MLLVIMGEVLADFLRDVFLFAFHSAWTMKLNLLVSLMSLPFFMVSCCDLGLFVY